MDIVQQIVDIDDCASGPCGHSGTCTDKINDYECRCAPGYDGKNCDNGKHTSCGIDNKNINCILKILMNVHLNHVVVTEHALIW